MKNQQTFDCFSSNEGDTWHDYPADAQIIEDVFGGDMPEVGDEYEITTGWYGVTAKYRITSVDTDGDCEVECVSHPQENCQQSKRVPLTDAQIKMIIPEGDGWKFEIGFEEAIAFARAIEAAHGIV